MAAPRPASLTSHRLYFQAGRTALHLAAERGHSNVVSRLVDCGGDEAEALSAEVLCAVGALVVSLLIQARRLLRQVAMALLRSPKKLFALPRLFDTLLRPALVGDAEWERAESVLASVPALGRELTRHGARAQSLIPAALATARNELVLQCLRDLRAGQERALRCRLVVLGNERAGKTTLLRRLREGEFHRHDITELRSG